MKKHEKTIEDYQRDGVVRIREFFPAETVRKIQYELDRYMSDDLATKPADARTLEADGQTVRNLWRLEEHNEFFRKLAEREEITSLVGKLVGGVPVLSGVETFNKPARVGSGVPYHQDNAYFCRTPSDMLTVWVAIDPVTAENGPVYFIKGSHKDGLLPSRPSGVTGNSVGMVDPPTTPLFEQFCALLEPGDVTIHHCETIHHSQSNYTDQPRLGLLFVYRGVHTRINEECQSAYMAAVAETPPA